MASACGFGLSLFFTLSAYLITTLLLKERGRTGTIDIPRFYRRRILRIWPLYLGVLGASVTVATLHHSFHKTALWYGAALVMMANLVTSETTNVVHLWSISVEEQFYVFWPTVMRLMSPRRLIFAALGLLVISNGVLAWYGLIHADTFKRVWWNTFVEMEFFATGILLALRDELITQKPYSWKVRIPGLMGVPILWFVAIYVFHIQGGNDRASGPISLCVGYALVAIACVSLIDLVRGIERWPKPIVYLGKISYGLYVFHLPILIAVRHIHFLILPAKLVVALALTIVVASLSYKWYESPFLRLKERYEVVPSRPVS